MKKRFLPIAIILLLALAACGRNTGDLVDQAGEAATRIAQEASDAAATAAAVATDIADGPDGEESPEEPEPTEEPPEGPTGETFEVDPTQPIEVEDSNGTQINFGDDPFEDENGNPPAGDVNVNVFTDEGAETEGSSNCEEPGTTEVLTVWSYNPETGLWEEENPAPIADDRCVEPVGTVSVEVSDDDGNKYDLAEGETAEVSVPCEPQPDEILTVWSYNEETGLWEEEDPVVIEQESERCSAEVSDLSGPVAFVAEPIVEGVVEGTIVNLNTGEAIFDAEVCVLSTLACAYTDANGFYSLSNVSAGEQTISAGNTGYIPTEEVVTVTGGETLTQDFALTAEVAEGVSPDWVELQEDTLQDPVFLTGFLLDDRTVTETQGQATLATGHIFAYRNFPYYRDHPLIGITSGMNGWALVISGTTEDMIFAPTAKESQTAAGSAALQNLITLTANTTLVIRDIGETNNSVKQGDIVEISYGSAGNMSLPYILTIYRPETGEILATFELNSQ